MYALKIMYLYVHSQKYVVTLESSSQYQDAFIFLLRLDDNKSAISHQQA